MAVLWAVLLAIAEPRSAVTPATSLESADAIATVGVTGEMVSEPVPKTSLVPRVLSVAVVPPGRAAVGGAATAAAASADHSSAAARLRAASASIRVG